MSTVEDIREQERERVRTRIRETTAEGDQRRDRLLDAVDSIPISRLTYFQTERGQVIGRRLIERELAEEFAEVGMGMAPLSSWINAHLADVGEDYVYRMFKRFEVFVAQAIPAYHTGEYDDFRTHLWILADLGLVRPTRTEPSGVQDRPDRQFYTLVEERQGDEAWRNPRRAKYPSHAPVPVMDAIDRSIRDEGGEPDLEAVAEQFDMTRAGLVRRLDQWNFDLERRVNTILSGTEGGE